METSLTVRTAQGKLRVLLSGSVLPALWVSLIGISIINDCIARNQCSRNGLYSFNIKCLCYTASCTLFHNLYYVDERHGMDRHCLKDFIQSLCYQEDRILYSLMGY